MPKVSIVIPCYNPGQYIHAAIESVLAQTLQDWELILVDDGSPEDLSGLRVKYPFIKLLRQNNSGQAAARNFGILSASGEFIAFMDQDDLWMPTKLERQVEKMLEASDIALCHTQFDFIDQYGNKTGVGFGRMQSYADLLAGSGICGASSVMVRTACLSGNLFDSSYEPAEDYELWLKLARQYKIAFIPSCEASYRIHSSNQTRDYTRTHAAIVRILKEHLRMAQMAGDARIIQATKAGFHAINKTFGAQAFDQCRDSFHDRDLRSLVGHLTFAVSKSPGATAASVASWAVRMMTNKSAAPTQPL